MVTGLVVSFVELMALVVEGSVLATGLAFVQLMYPVLMGLVELQMVIGLVVSFVDLMSVVAVERAVGTGLAFVQLMYLVMNLVLVE